MTMELLRNESVKQTLVDMPWHDDARMSVAAHKMVLLVGGSGDGKTTFAIETARAATGKEPEILAGSPETDKSEVFGMYTLAGNATVFVDGPLPRALKNGTWLVVDEMNLIPLGCRAALLALRDLASITNPINNEVVRIPPEFRLLATSNPETMKCKRHISEVAVPLYSGFMILEVPPLAPAMVARLLRHHFPKASEERIKVAIRLWDEYRNLRPNGNDGAMTLSYRAAAHLVKLLELGMSEDKAVTIALVNTFIIDPDMHSMAKVKAMVG